jgi:hypothetical protein
MIPLEPAQAVPTSRRSAAPQDWSRVQRLYAFCRLRAIDRLALAQEHHPEDTSRERRELRVLETMYGKARHHDDIVTSCAVTYFRAQAMKDAHHPDFIGEWI